MFEVSCAGNTTIYRRFPGKNAEELSAGCSGNLPAQRIESIDYHSKRRGAILLSVINEVLRITTCITCPPFLSNLVSTPVLLQLRRTPPPVLPYASKPSETHATASFPTCVLLALPLIGYLRTPGLGSPALRSLRANLPEALKKVIKADLAYSHHTFCLILSDASKISSSGHMSSVPRTRTGCQVRKPTAKSPNWLFIADVSL